MRYIYIPKTKEIKSWEHFDCSMCRIDSVTVYASGRQQWAKQVKNIISKLPRIRYFFVFCDPIKNRFNNHDKLIGLNSMIEFVSENKTRVYVNKAKDLCHNFDYFTTVMNKIRKSNTDVFFINEKSQDRKYIDNVVKRAHENILKTMKIFETNLLHGRTKYGFMKMDGEIVSNSEEMKVVARIIDLYLKRESYKSILKTLKRLGIRNRHNIQWTKHSITNITRHYRDGVYDLFADS